MLAYLSLGEVNENRWYFKYVKRCVTGKNPIRKYYYINLSCKTWKNVLLDTVIPKIVEKGFNGLFLDNVDVVDKYPKFKDDMTDLIKDIRARYPNLILIQNRGFSIINKTAKYVNGVVFECFTTYYQLVKRKV
ncbi:endo alpha-1,4 polygalactosaminidase [Archaeoglobus sp.]